MIRVKLTMLAMVVSSLVAVVGYADGSEWVGGYNWSYWADNYVPVYGGVAVAGRDMISPAPTGSIEVPASLGGYPVAVLNHQAFAFNDSITAVMIPASVKEIGQESFCGCANLRTVTFLGDCPKVPNVENNANADDGWVFYGTPEDLTVCVYEDARGWPSGNRWFGKKLVRRPRSSLIVRFEVNGGHCSESERSVSKGKTIGVLPAPQRSGYAFKGWYLDEQLTKKATSATKVTADMTLYASWLYDASAYVSVKVRDGDEGLGKVSGGNKSFKAGVKVQIKATANKGAGFSGWFENGELVSQSASYTFEASGHDTILEAGFISAEEDWLELRYVHNGVGYEVGQKVFSKQVWADSGSAATISVNGLPSGIKYDAKTEQFSGTFTKEGTHYITCTAKNANGYTHVLTMVWQVGGLWGDPYYSDKPPAWSKEYNGIGISRELWDLLNRFQTGVPVDLKLSADGITAISGLPNGLSFDKKAYAIVGMPTKPGAYAITLQAGRQKTVRMAIVEDSGCRFLDIWAQDGGTATGRGVYSVGSTVKISAKAKNGYVFAGWYADGSEFNEVKSGDYRTASDSFVLTKELADANMSYCAEFVAKEDDKEIYFDCADEWNVDTGMESDEFSFAVSSHSRPTISVRGLPAGLKLNGIKLVADVAKVKPGIYPVTISAVNQSKAQAVFEMKIDVPMKGGVRVDVENNETDDDGRLLGSVSGQGYFMPGGKVSLKATPKKGYVFAGWEGLLPDQTSDWQDPTLSFTAPLDVASLALTARFIPIREDWLEIGTWGFVKELAIGESVKYSFKTKKAGVSDFSSGSQVSLKVTGLPSGLKYDAKTMTVSGAPKQKGVYYPVFSAVNAGGYKIDKVSRLAVGGADDGDYDDISRRADVHLHKLMGLEVGEEVYLYLAYQNETVGLSATGLPKGLSIVSEDDGYYAICKGIPSKAGSYVVKFSTKESCCGLGKKTAQKTVVVDGAPSQYLNVLSTEGGTASGSGIYHAGTLAKASAKAGLGCVFAGWYEDDYFENPVRSESDHRQLQLSQMVNSYMVADPVARFVTKAEDIGYGVSIRGYDATAEVERDEWRIESDDARYLLVVDSLSCPKVTVKGLPSGVELAKEVVWENLPNGKEAECYVIRVKDATKLSPGNYSATVTAVNESKKTLTKTIQIVIPNIRNWIFNGVDYSENGNHVMANSGARIEIGFYDEWLDGKVSVKGLPSGMKMYSPTSAWNDIRSIYFEGVPTKSGSYTVSVTVKKSSKAYAMTMTINVDPLPVWLVGTYGGAGILLGSPNYWTSPTLDRSTSGMHSFTISDKGKVSGKMIMCDETASFAIGLKNPTYAGDGSLVSIETDYAHVKVKGQDRYFCYVITREDGPRGSKLGQVQLNVYDTMGCPKGVSGVLGQNLWLRKDLVLPSLKDLTCELVERGFVAKFDASGNVVVAGELNGKAVSAVAPLILESEDLDADGLGVMTVSAYVCLPKTDVRFKCLFDISIAEDGVDVIAVQTVAFDDFTQD